MPPVLLEGNANRPESKYSDGSTGAITFGHGITGYSGGTGQGRILATFQQAQGAAENERIGNRTEPKSMRVTGHFLATGVPTGPILVRMAVIVDRQPIGGVPPNINEIFYADGRRNLHTTKRFQTLRMKKYVLRSDAGSTKPGRHFDFTVYFPRKPGKRFATTYQGATSGLGDVSSNAIYIVLFTDPTVTTASTDYDVVGDIATRLKYGDD